MRANHARPFAGDPASATRATASAARSPAGAGAGCAMLLDTTEHDASSEAVAAGSVQLVAREARESRRDGVSRAPARWFHQPARGRKTAGLQGPNLYDDQCYPQLSLRSRTPPRIFAALFEESLSRQEMRHRRSDHRRSRRASTTTSSSSTPGSSPKASSRSRNSRTTAARSKSSPATSSPSRSNRSKTATARPRLSRDKAKRLAAWHDLEEALETGHVVQGLVTGKVKGGLTVMVNGIRAFLPGSLVDIRPVKDTSPYENKQLEFKVIKLDRKRNNVVVSRRAVLEESQGEEREKLLATLQEGAIVKGIVKNITDYGAFVDLGGIDGLLHITDLAWRRVKHPSEVLAVGDEVTAKVLKFDQEKNRVSLGLKQLGEDPWVGLVAPLPAGHAPVRQGHQPHRLRRVRRDRVGHRRPGARLRDGLDQQERASVQGRAARRRGRGDDPRDRRGPPPHLARHEAVHAEPVGRVRA